MPKTILIVGATGKQGKALVNALCPLDQDASKDQPAESHPFRILALTRNASSPTGQLLAKEKHVEVVEGDLDSPESIRKIFEAAKDTGGIWGVFCVLAYPGLGANADGEERQGKMMADLALEYGVSTYIYSSSERGGDKNDDNERLSGRAKVSIERHIKGFPDRGMSWIIMRPGFFLDNFEGFMGSITVAVFKSGLGPDSCLGVVDSVDVGSVAAAIFQNPEKYKHKELVVIGDVLTMSQQQDIYKRTTGRPLPAIPSFLARLLLIINKPTHDLVQHFEKLHYLRKSGQHDRFPAQLQLGREAYPGIKSFESWALGQNNKSDTSRKGAWDGGWNKVSLWRLVTGKT
ncbi:hypothetical protein HYDPIDRAFT_109338 [Hydnomerulius pinastri MD-312]|nr:hypothetical protein HYDPIDRAFT_109338 [Hydnomerulius pinastri MD-312]